MSESTTLLISQDSSVIRLVEKVIDSIGKLQLEVYETIEEAHSQVHHPDVQLVLVQTTAASDDAEVTRLLWEIVATKRPISTLVLTDKYLSCQAVALLRAGAADYLELPQNLDKLAHRIDGLTMRSRMGGCAGTVLDEPVIHGSGKNGFHVLTPEMVELMEQVRRIAPQDTTVLLTGETGTGKTRLAKLVHQLSPRREEPFLVVDCGALSPNLVESEMFGHVKGAFTGADRDRQGKLAAAGKGTLLLDEINSLPSALQAKLLRAVDERVFEPVGSNRPQPLQARLVACSNTPLETEVAEGRFRADLFYRLNVISFYLPPLRDWRHLTPTLAKKLLSEFTAESTRSIRGISTDALLALEQYDWPGNIRELRNVIERAVALCPTSEIQVSDLPEAVRRGNAWMALAPPQAACPAAGARPGRSLTLDQSKQEAEISSITGALQKHRNNRLRAAAELGISRMALYRKLHKYGMVGTK